MDLALVTPTVEYSSYLATCNTQILRGKYETKQATKVRLNLHQLLRIIYLVIKQGKEFLIIINSIL